MFRFSSKNFFLLYLSYCRLFCIFAAGNSSKQFKNLNIMKKSVKIEFEKLINVINESNSDLGEVISFESFCFDIFRCEYAIEVSSSIFHSLDFASIYSFVTIHNCSLFITADDDLVFLNIQ